jgi:triosephosphate isomerase
MILAANLKTNHTRRSFQEYLQAVTIFIQEETIGAEALVFPPATALRSSTASVTVGAQNAYPIEKGSCTGEIGTEQLEEFGIQTILIGHSERRHQLGESLDLVRQKFDFFAGKGYRIVFCIGEPLAVKEQGIEAIMAYIKTQLEGIDLGYENLVLAYEPVWAIGTGKSASSEDIARIHAAIKALCDKPLLYGGSAKLDNCASILSLKGVDGLLVGTASWESKGFCDMLQTTKTIDKD